MSDQLDPGGYEVKILCECVITLRVDADDVEEAKVLALQDFEDCGWEFGDCDFTGEPIIVSVK